MRVMSTFSLDPEPHLDLGKESLVLPIVVPGIEFQAPDHLSAVMFCQITEDLAQGRPFCGAPVCDPAICVGQGSHGRGGTEWFDKGQRDGEVGCGKAGCEVEDMASYGIAGW